MRKTGHHDAGIHDNGTVYGSLKYESQDWNLPSRFLRLSSRIAHRSKCRRSNLRVELARARLIAEELKALLAPECQRIEVAGSIRRRKPFPNDIELLCIPKYVDGVDQLDEEIKKLMAEGLLGHRRNVRGSIAYGPKNKLLVHLPSGIGVDVFSTDEECWWVSLVVRTGGEVTNKRIATAALRKGWHLQAYGHGFSTPQGDVVCRAEDEVFRAVGLPYMAPERRE